jgi:hypothetical protein
LSGSDLEKVLNGIDSPGEMTDEDMYKVMKRFAAEG